MALGSTTDSGQHQASEIPGTSLPASEQGAQSPAGPVMRHQDPAGLLQSASEPSSDIGAGLSSGTAPAASAQLALGPRSSLAKGSQSSSRRGITWAGDAQSSADVDSGTAAAPLKATEGAHMVHLPQEPECVLRQPQGQAGSAGSPALSESARQPGGQEGDSDGTLQSQPKDTAADKVFRCDQQQQLEADVLRQQVRVLEAGVRSLQETMEQSGATWQREVDNLHASLKLARRDRCARASTSMRLSTQAAPDVVAVHGAQPTPNSSS